MQPLPSYGLMCPERSRRAQLGSQLELRRSFRSSSKAFYTCMSVPHGLNDMKTLLDAKFRLVCVATKRRPLLIVIVRQVDANVPTTCRSVV